MTKENVLINALFNQFIEKIKNKDNIKEIKHECSIAYVSNSITVIPKAFLSLKIVFLNSRFNYFRRNSDPQIQNDAETLTQTRHLQ